MPMATNVVMPQMGESIAEGTIVRWIKKVGENVDRDEPLFEISTDKVDAEIPSPGAGVLTEIKVKEGETVPVNSVVAVIGAAGGAVVSAPAPAPRTEAAVSQGDGDSALPEAAVGQPDTPSSGGRAAAAPAAAAPAASAPASAPAPAAPAGSVEDLRRQKSSPLVRRIAREHNVYI